MTPTPANQDPTPTFPPESLSRIRVRYSECDPMGVAHHASYAPWLEIARTDFLRHGGISYAQLEQAGIFLVITRLEIKYRRPVRYDDVIDVRVQVVGGGHVKLEHTYELLLIERTPSTPGAIQAVPVELGQTLAVANTTLACVNNQGKIIALPKWLQHSPTSPAART